MLHRVVFVGLLYAALLTSVPSSAQELNARERAREPYNTGLEHMRGESFDAAVRAFQTAISIDPQFEMAHYMLGRAQLAHRNYTPAVYALEKSRDLYRTDSTRQFTDKQERQRLIRERAAEIDQLIVETREAAALPQNATRRFSLLEQVRQYEERKRQLQDLDRTDVMRPTLAVPGFVSLSLGSAYFRAGKLPQAEQAYLAAIAADPKIGEAHNNLAVVYLETGRYDEANRAVRAAEKRGFRVHPELKAEIAAKRKSS